VRVRVDSFRSPRLGARAEAVLLRRSARLLAAGARRQRVRGAVERVALSVQDGGDADSHLWNVRGAAADAADLVVPRTRHRSLASGGCARDGVVGPVRAQAMSETAVRSKRCASSP